MLRRLFPHGLSLSKAAFRLLPSCQESGHHGISGTDRIDEFPLRGFTAVILSVFIEEDSSLSGHRDQNVAGTPLLHFLRVRKDLFPGPQIDGKDLGDELLLSECMLRYEGDLFLCGMSLEELSEKLNVKITKCSSDGWEMFSKMIGE